MTAGAGGVLIAIAVALALPVPGAATADTTEAVTAAFLFNFAKFAEWPDLAPNEPIALCVVGDEGVAAALGETAAGHEITGHALKVSRPRDSRTWTDCHLLFISKGEFRSLAPGKLGLTSLPVLTVSDRKGFSLDGGAIELYIDDGQMRFAVNLDTVKRSGIRLSSRLLGLAKLVS
jgi:hypothetical protein